MEYWKVDWLHDFESEPTRIYGEIGHDGYEVRKVQHYRDGRRLKSDEFHESAEIGLSEIPVGAIGDVAGQPEFTASSITLEEFERAWRDASWPPGPRNPSGSAIPET
ncbi:MULTISPECIES: DUF6881 domain-containing protein [Streptomyces]|uniref:DUF6881 domain-containing protein n=1 Tax=Streptomyces TaxID=1883 RepID=UPI0016785756|nr:MULTISPECIES: hypothetical protein [Streptomyces]MBK3523860.1 hypothetical protein [Streptomyces sp. MBT70]GGR99044.1 hypothetical protein GCM10010236_62250 [Streptomyces eurythermus]